MDTPKPNLSRAAELDHTELEPVVRELVRRYRPLRVICFGSLRQSVSSVGCFLQQRSSHDDHYFLLMVTESSTRIEHEVQALMTSMFQEMTIAIVVHGRGIIDSAISKGNRFFITVQHTGTLLYNTDGYAPFLAAVQLPEVDTVHTHLKAERHHAHRHHMAEGFVQGAESCLEMNYYNNAVFMMHQAIEQACIGLIRVWIGYRSEMHNLDRLLKLTLCFSPEPSAVFPRKTEEEKRLFGLLHRCYSEARYKTQLTVSSQEAESLYGQCTDFVRLVGSLCKNRISAYKAEAAAAAQHIIDYSPALNAGLLG